MKDISDWLVKIEILANEIYNEGASIFKEDKAFRALLINLAKDEAEHALIMKKASKHLQGHPIPNYAIKIDPETRERIELPLNKSLELIREGQITKEDFAHIIIESEFSEWNDILTYVIRTILFYKNGFDVTLPNMDDHLNDIKNFFLSSDYARGKIEDIIAHTSAGNGKILVVDDDDLVGRMLQGILKHEGDVQVALNGKEALDMVEKNNYKLIVSDVDMPVMNGLDFFNKAAALRPEISGSFIFFTGDLTDQKISFFHENNVQYLGKPSSIKEILDTALKIMYGIRIVK